MAQRTTVQVQRECIEALAYLPFVEAIYCLGDGKEDVRMWVKRHGVLEMRCRALLVRLVDERCAWQIIATPATLDNRPMEHKIFAMLHPTAGFVASAAQAVEHVSGVWRGERDLALSLFHGTGREKGGKR